MPGIDVEAAYRLHRLEALRDNAGVMDEVETVHGVLVLINIEACISLGQLPFGSVGHDGGGCEDAIVRAGQVVERGVGIMLCYVPQVVIALQLEGVEGTTRVI